ncbi:hypothetical protein [Pseudoduganella chitinolytica]|uniref:Uncharacterized protein n=1 Tax=Pseudoduganella chitinolytica TaxID=34070 RepID=A0ABY8B444_9BURK|nr:hypothetical protein [Pseudoduganella chitinolytica]WEF30635.1 hypothetical protein PX653_14220 [Pseudoduganella chitinolytica]
MQTNPTISRLLSDLMAQARALHEACPIGYLRQLEEATTARQFHDVASALCYAANSKELRDGAEDEVHFWCHEIWLQCRQLREALTIRLVPGTVQQHGAWQRAIARAAASEYQFEREGILEANLLDVELHGAALRVVRRWVHAGQTGESARFDLALDPVQAEAVRARLATAVEMQGWIDSGQARAMARTAA